MNNKGFMMAEVIVVSAIILVFMTGLYLSYGKLFGQYNTRINYYDSETLYAAAYYRDTLIKEDNMNDALAYAKTKRLSKLFTDNYIDKNNSGDNLVLVYNPNQNLSRVTGVKKTFTDYVNYLRTSMKFTSNYVLLLERCYNDDCTYAYLEVYDGKEA